MQYLSWLIGVSLAIIANIISNLGLNVQKKAHSLREKHNKFLYHKVIHDEDDDTMDDSLEEQETNDPNNNNMNDNYLEQHQTLKPKQMAIDHESDINQSLSNKETNFNINSKSNSNSKSETTKIKIKLKHKNNIKKNDICSSYIFDGVWILGLFLQIIGAFLDFAALGFAPESVVAALGALTLLVNVFLAPIMHSERPSLKTIFATLIIVAGSITTVTFSARRNRVDSIQQVYGLYNHSAFVVYACVISIGLCFLYAVSTYLSWMSETESKKKQYSVYFYKIHRFIVAALSGIMGAQNMLFAKSISTLFVLSIKRKKHYIFLQWQTYVLLLGLIITIFFQLRWLNSGLKKFSALYIVPTFQSFWMTISVIGGLVVYQEYSEMTYYERTYFPIGVFITLFGVIYLTTKGHHEQIKNIDGDPK